MQKVAPSGLRVSNPRIGCVTVPTNRFREMVPMEVVPSCGSFDACPRRDQATGFSLSGISGLARISTRCCNSRRSGCSFVFMRAPKPFGVIGTLAGGSCSDIDDKKLWINLAWLAIQTREIPLKVICHPEISELFF
jgi:hypothetical protein